MVADDAAVHALYEGPDGVTAGLRSGSVAIDMSTVLPDTIRAIAPAIRARRGGVLDAPVSGSVSSTLSGQLTIMVGGEAADLERARPVLERLAHRIFHLGPLGSGTVMKLAVNTVIYGLNGAVAEGLVLAERNGIDRSAAYDVLAVSAVGAPYLGYKRAAFIEPDATPVAFALELADKDLRPHPRTGRELRVTHAAERHEPRTDPSHRGSAGEGADFSMVASHLREEGRR